ncbi:MAG: hypothetical protein GF392_04250, partial [Candidatus Omnitrophica bacterium]|nr:hypothetical protein [Candidatus Omnitrophota bacterium]
KDGGLEELMKGENNVHEKAAGLLDRIGRIRKALEKVDRIDPSTRGKIEDWLDDAVGRIKDFPDTINREILHNTVDLREVLSDKTNKSWGHGHSTDRSDILGSSSQDDDSYMGELDPQTLLPGEETVIYGQGGLPDTSSSSGDSTSWRKKPRLGDMSNDVIAGSITKVGEPSLRPLDTGIIIKMLEQTGNWAYMARQRGTSFSSSAKSRMSSENRTTLKGLALAAMDTDPAEATELFLAAGELADAISSVQRIEVRENSFFDRERKDRLIANIVRGLIDSQDAPLLRDAFTLAEQMLAEDERDTELGNIARGLIEAGMLEHAREVATHIQSKLKRIKALADTAKAQYRAGSFDEAEETARMIPEDSRARPRVLDEIKRARKNADLRSGEHASDDEAGTRVGNSTAVVDSGTGTRFGYIEPFADDEPFRQRVDHARRSARALLVATKPGSPQTLLGWTGNNRDFRMYYGSPTGYFESKDRAFGLKHEVDITIVVDGMTRFTGEPVKYRKDDENIPEDIRDAIDEIRDADIECFNIYIAGTDNLEMAFRSEESLSPSTRAALQRLFMRITRRDIPVTGSTSVIPPLASALEPFEEAYVAEMVAELETVQTQLLSLNEERARLPVMQLTETEKAAMKEARASIEMLQRIGRPKKKRYDELTAIRRRLETEKAAMDEERRPWKMYLDKKKRGEEVSEEEKDSAARIGAATQVKYGDYYERRDKVQTEYNELYKELIGIQQELKEKQSEYRQLRNRYDEYEEARRDIEESSAIKHREKELLVKRIEEAQHNIPIVEGSIISGRYKVTGKVGQGGAGVVFRVMDMQKKEEKALKFLSKGMVDEKALLRFKREQDVMEKMNPVETGAPIPVLEERNGHYAGREYFVMTMVPGIPLDVLISRLKKGDLQLTAREKETLAYALSLTLAKFHGGVVIHRDLKPGNIIIPADENGYPVIPEVADVNKAKRPNSRFMTDLVSRIRIIDLGIALMGEEWAQDETGSHAVQEDLTLITGEYGDKLVGTPMYMSPEQAKGGKEAIPHSLWDCYSMGVILYELFSHDTPYGKRKSFYELLNLIVDREVVPRPLIDVIKDNNARNRVTTDAQLYVNEARLDRIRHGLVDELALEEDENKRVI